jgi:hypothetical protein
MQTKKHVWHFAFSEFSAFQICRICICNFRISESVKHPAHVFRIVHNSAYCSTCLCINNYCNARCFLLRWCPNTKTKYNLELVLSHWPGPPHLVQPMLVQHKAKYTCCWIVLNIVKCCHSHVWHVFGHHFKTLRIMVINGFWSVTMFCH